MRWAAIILVLLDASKAADACSFSCDRTLVIHTPVADAGLPTNGNLLVYLPLTVMGAVPEMKLGRADGGDGDAGVPFSVHLLSGAEFGPCLRVARVQPGQALLAQTEYRLEVTGPWDGGSSNVAGQIAFLTSTGPDVVPPAPPVVQSMAPADAFCASCMGPGPFGSGVYVQLRSATPGDAVWFAPLSPRIDDFGSEWGFELRFACGRLQGNTSAGPNDIEVIAFDSAWNMSEIATVHVDGTCATIDPCTNKPLTFADAGPTPLSGPPGTSEGPQGCGCNSVTGLAFGLILPVVAFTRRRSSRGMA